MRVVVVGGGQAGGRLVQLLAADGQRWDLTLVCREPYPPYQRPPLSKGILRGTDGFATCDIWPRDDPAWSTVQRHMGIAATAIDRQAKSVDLSNGERLGYDALVLATGSCARRLVCAGATLDQIHTLRTIDDAMAIAARFAAGKRLVVVGGGFIGLEVAACARQRRLDVTVVEASDRLLARVVTPDIAGLVARHHRAEGVVLKMGTMVERFIGNSRGGVKAVELSCGEIVPCDLAVVGIGAMAETGIAAAAGLAVVGGICVDASLRTSDPAIFACGDIVSFWHPLFEQHIRVESWHNAQDHARIVASVLRGVPATCDSIPWFWSDQYGMSLQIAGLPHLGSSSVARHLDDGTGMLFHLGPTGRILGATGFGHAESIGRDIRVARELIAARANPDPAALRDPRTRLKSLIGQHPATALRTPQSAAV